MGKQELQKILVAWSRCCKLTNTMYTAIFDKLDNWDTTFLLCCEEFNDLADEIIDLLEDWAAEYEATWEDYLCEQTDPTITTTTTTATPTTTSTTTATPTTTTTTYNPYAVDWIIEFQDYICQQEDDPDITTTIPLKSEEIVFEATWDDYLCELEDDPLVTTTTTTADPSATTTTTTTVDPEDVEFRGTWDEFLCEMEDDPLQTTTTTSTTINEEPSWEIAFEDYVCQQTDVTTTTTTAGPTTTTTTAPVTTTTTTVSTDCGETISGEMAFPEIHHINLGSSTGVITLTIDTVDVPDKFIVEWNGMEVINTGYRGDSAYQSALYAALIASGADPEIIAGASTGVFTFNKTTADAIATVKVYAPIEETIWSFTLSCAGVATTTTTAQAETFLGEYTDFVCEEESDGITTTTTTEEPVTTTTSTTTPATTTTTTVGIYNISCGPDEISGEYAPLTIYVVTLGSDLGNVVLTYDSLDVADRFVVEFEGVPVIDTGLVTGTGSESFYKDTATTVAVIKVYAPDTETKWSFTIACPDGATTTTTTEAAPTTTTTTTSPVTTTTTTGQAPVSSANSVDNTRTAGCDEAVILTPSDFTYTDADGGTLEYVKITSYTIAGSGTLTYDGVAVTDGQVLQVVGGAGGSFMYTLLYTPDSTSTSAFSDTINFLVRTAGNENYG